MIQKALFSTISDVCFLGDLYHERAQPMDILTGSRAFFYRMLGGEPMALLLIVFYFHIFIIIVNPHIPVLWHLKNAVEDIQERERKRDKNGVL
jgi:hypothetical protein